MLKKIRGWLASLWVTYRALLRQGLTFLRFGDSSEQTDNDGRTPLTSAISNGCRMIVNPAVQ